MESQSKAMFTSDPEAASSLRGIATSGREAAYAEQEIWSGDQNDSPMPTAATLSDTVTPISDHHQSQIEHRLDLRADFAFGEQLKALNQQAITNSLGLLVKMMSDLALPSSWCASPRLYCIFRNIDRVHLLSGLLDAGISDLWLPLHSRVVRRFLNAEDAETYMKYQVLVLDKDIPADLEGRHFNVNNIDQPDISRVKYLGAGGFGEVYHVEDQRNGQAYACKTLIRPPRYDIHVELMRNFKREVMGMRRVRHRHCVDLVGSCADMESVAVLSSPVADMDLAVFLDMDLSKPQYEFLRQSIGCITSALAYLHNLGIRHDDLKPNNILIHGHNILLTDFGFWYARSPPTQDTQQPSTDTAHLSLDSSDTGITTTSGPPKHSTRRYSAPEVFDHEPRNRLTDIWSLGCVLVDIVSRLLGYFLEDTKQFWLSNGSKIDSYAENSDATGAWLTKLAQDATEQRLKRFDWLLSFIRHLLLEKRRLKRPTARQILDRLTGFHWSSSGLEPVEPVIGACCNTPSRGRICLPSSRLYRPYLWPVLDDLGVDRRYEVIFLNWDLSVLASNEHLDLQGDISTILDREEELEGVRCIVSKICAEVQSKMRTTVMYDQPPMRDYNTYLKSFYLSCDGASFTLNRHLYLTYGSRAAYSHHVHFFYTTLQFELDPARLNKPDTAFITMCFDRTQPGAVRYTDRKKNNGKRDAKQTAKGWLGLF